MTTDPTHLHPSDFEALFDAAVDAAAATTAPLETDPTGRSQFLVPVGYEIRTVDNTDFAPHPDRKAGKVALTEPASFVAYVSRHWTGQTECYADEGGIAAVLNGHGPTTPGWADHVATLKFVTTPAWRRWSQADGKLLEQTDFAELVEAGLPEIVDPPAGDLLELAQSLQATTRAAFRSDRRLANGQTQVQYVEEIEASAGRAGELTIPHHITLLMAPFYGFSPVTIQARFRYRLSGGKLTMGVWLDAREETLRAAVRTEVSRVQVDIAETVESPVLMLWGRPGA